MAAIAVVAIAVIGLLILHTNPVQRRVLNWSVGELERRFDLDLVADDLHYNLATRRVTHDQRAAGGARPPGRPVFRRPDRRGASALGDLPRAVAIRRGVDRAAAASPSHATRAANRTCHRDAAHETRMRRRAESTSAACRYAASTSPIAISSATSRSAPRRFEPISTGMPVRQARRVRWPSSRRF